MKRAIYAGTFDPFHWGHYDTLCKASKLFDEIFIVLANNPDKPRMFPARKMADAIHQFMVTDAPEDSKIGVKLWSGLVGELAYDLQANHSIRTLRNPFDYTREEDVVKFNKKVNPWLETIYFRADGGSLDITSSENVRELFRMVKGKRIDSDWCKRYVPLTIYECMKKEG